MGLDTVSLSTKKNMYTVYKDWRYSDSKLDFKTYLLEKDERIEAFANSFKQYNSGDMFTKESVVELEDGRLLCFDPDEFSKAYLIDLRDITKNDINFDMETDFKMIKADKSKKGYETRNNAVLSYLGSDIKTKDGQTLDAYLNQIEASDDSTIVNGETKKNQFYYKNISQMSTDKDEQEYYKLIIESLEGSVDNDGKITIGDSSLSKLNDKIKQFEKYLNSPSQQNYLNTLVLLQQLGLSELELIEKLSPGFLEQVKTYTSSLQEQYGDTISYTDDNGFQSSTSQIISFEKIMTYKYNNSDKYWMYLSLEDRDNVYDNSKRTFSEDGGRYSNFSQVKAAKALISLSSSTSASLESTMEANLEQSVFDTAIDGYVKDFNAMFANGNPAYDEALEFLTILCTEKVSGEILFGFLQDSNVQQNLAMLGAQKGTLPTAQTADKQADEQLTAKKVGDAMAAKINTYVEETYTIMGDKERIEKQKALNATISFLDLAFGGINVKYNKNQGWYFVGGAATELVAQTGLYVWSKYAANSIVEKSTTKVLENATGEAAEKAAQEAKKRYLKQVAKTAADEAREKVIAEEVEKQLKDKIKEKCKEIGKLQKTGSEDFFKRKAMAYLNSVSSGGDVTITWRQMMDLDPDFAELIETMRCDGKLDKSNINDKIDDICVEWYKKKYSGRCKQIEKEIRIKVNKSTSRLQKNAADEAAKKAKDAVGETAEKTAQAAKEAEKKVYEAASDLKTAKANANEAAKKYRQAQKNLKGNLGDIIKNIDKTKTENKDLIEKLKKLNKGKTVDLTTDDFNKIKNITGVDVTKLTKLEDLSQKADEVAKTLEKAKNLRQKAKGGIVGTLNSDVKINRHGGKTTSVKNKSWFNKADDVADAIAKSVDLDGEGVKLGKLADGVEKVADETLEASSKKIVNNTRKNASKTATKVFRLGGVLSKAFMAVDCVSAAIDGGMMGYGIAAWAVEKNAKNFVKADGSYDTTRASWVKGLGAASGACLGLAAGMLTSGVGAAINAATGGIAGTVVSVVVGGVGALLGLASVALCCKWFG